MQFTKGVSGWRDESQRALNIARIGAPIVIAALIWAVWYRAANPNRAELGVFRDALSLSIAPDEIFDNAYVFSASCIQVTSGGTPFMVEEDRWESWDGLDRTEIARADALAFEDSGWAVQRYVERTPDAWYFFRSEFRAAQGFGFVATNDELAITFVNGQYQSHSMDAECSFRSRFVSSDDVWEPVDEFPDIEMVKVRWDAETETREIEAMRGLLGDLPVESVDQRDARAVVAGQPSYCSVSAFYSGEIVSQSFPAAEIVDAAAASLTDAGWSVGTGIQAFVATSNGDFITGVVDNSANGLFIRRYPTGCTPIPVPLAP